jgi:hypothetical protein
MEQGFGPIPAWAAERLAGMHPRAVIALGSRMLRAKSLEELLQEGEVAQDFSPFPGGRNPPY